MPLEYDFEISIEGYDALKLFINSNINLMAERQVKLNFTDEVFRFECFVRFRKIFSDRLNVFLSGGGRKKSDRSTLFHRQSWLKSVDGTGICIEDPMYKLNKNIKNGFYYGTAQHSIITSLKAFIDILMSELSVKKSQLYLTGSSCGGYAALMLSCYFEGCNVIVMNPQILPCTWDRQDTDIYVKEVDPSFADKNSTRNVANEILVHTLNRYFIYFNIGSRRDLEQAKILLGDKTHFETGINQPRSNIIVYFFELACVHPHDVWLNLDEFLIVRHLIKHQDSMQPELFTSILNSVFETMVSRYKALYEGKFLDFAVKLLQEIRTEQNLSFKVLKQNKEIIISTQSGFVTAIVHINDYVSNNTHIYISAQSFELVETLTKLGFIKKEKYLEKNLSKISVKEISDTILNIFRTIGS